MTKESFFLRLVKFIATYITSIPLLALAAPFFRTYEYMTMGAGSVSPNSPEIHRGKVERVQEQVRDWNKRGRPNRMCTARKAWKTLSVHNMKKSKFTQIQVDGMDDVVEIDEVARVLTVEPGMMFGKLTNILIPKGWTVPVVPEFETLTVGGVTCGGGLETSSHKHGCIGDTLLAVEIVLASGEVVTCSREEQPDLFYSIPWSHGTLGFVTAVKLPLVRAKKFVKLEYIPTKSAPEARQLLESSQHEFVEGIQFAPKQFVVMHGDMVDEAPQGGTVNHLNRWYKPWFYKHVESFLRRHPSDFTGAGSSYTTEYIPLRDYYHRHTRSYFWETPIVLWYGNATLVRWLLGWIYPINFQLGKFLLPQSFFEAFFVTNHMLQDFIIPLAGLEASLEFIHDKFEIYPIWLCPVRIFKRPGMIQGRGSEAELYVDVGIYGTVPAGPKRDAYHPEHSTRLVEEYTREHSGIQGLYADSYMTRSEFRDMFDMRLYDEVRARYGAEAAFPDVYDKVSKAARRIKT